jgi:hypothetical protein
MTQRDFTTSRIAAHSSRTWNGCGTLARKPRAAVRRREPRGMSAIAGTGAARFGAAARI